MVYVKFGYTKNCAKRFKTYAPACKFASVEYSCEISKNMPLDDYINQNVLKKNSSRPVVDFCVSKDSRRKIDWFKMHRSSANMILSYMTEIKSMGGEDDYNAFSKYILSAIIAEPDDIEKYIDRRVMDAFTELTIKFEQKSKDFFERNFKRGGMMPIKEMRKHPEWKKKYLDDAELKDIHMCKSCPDRSYSGCCPEYSATNRKKVRMVIGWHC